MYARYKSHGDATLSYLQDALRRFHKFQDVFLLAQAGKIAKAKADSWSMEVVEMRMVDKETLGITWTLSKKWCKMNAWREYLSHEVDGSKELDAKLNFPKIHLMSHSVRLICRYGALQQFCGKRHGHARTTKLKAIWNASNHNLNYLPQVITIQYLILCFEMRVLNLETIGQLQEKSSAPCTVLPSGA